MAAVARVLALAAASLAATGCGPTVGSALPTGASAAPGPTGSEPGSSEGPGPSGSPTLPGPTRSAVDPEEGRLVWTVDADGNAGIWTTDLAGRDVRPLLVGQGDTGGAIREATLVGSSVAYLRDSPAGPRLWVVGPDTLPVPLLDGVIAFVVTGEGGLIAARDTGPTVDLLRFGPLDAPGGGVREPPERLGSVSTAGTLETSVGAFGLAVSPDGRSIAAGWIGGRVEVVGPRRATLRDVGAPLVVTDDGTVRATTGRAGEAYLLDGETLTELAPPDSDPVVAPGTGLVAWPVIGDDGTLGGVAVLDVVTGTTRSYPAAGAATNVRSVSGEHVLLEATAFDPLARTVAWLDLRDGRFATFALTAPPAGG